MNKIKKVKSRYLNFFGIKFEIWKVIEGYRLTIDINQTRYILKLFGIDKCSTKNLI